VHADTGALSGGVQAADGRPLGVGDHLAVHVGGDAAHAIVGGRLDGAQPIYDVHADELEGDVAHLGQAFHDFVAAQVTQVQVDALAVFLDAAPLVNLALLGAAHQVARGQLHLVRRVLLHEALAGVVEQVAALAATGFAHQDAVPVEARRVKLHELHVHQRDAGVVGDGHAVAGVGQGVGGDLPGAPVAARAEHDRFGAQGDDLARVDVHGDHALAHVVFHDQVEGEPLAVELDAVLVRLLVNGVQQDVPGPVGGVVGAGDAMPAEAPLSDTSVGRAAEDTAHVLVGINDVNGLFDHDLDGVLVAQPVRPLDGVEHMQLPAINRLGVGRNLLQRAARAGAGDRTDVVQRGGDAALGRPAV